VEIQEGNKMSIWFKDYKLEDLINFGNRNAVLHLGIEFTELNPDSLKGKMPVDHRTKTPLGLLHGGVSCVLAETLGSCASYLCIDPDKYNTVGIEINANHIKSIDSGYVVGIAKPIHLGRSLHVWDIRIHSESDNKLICISRLTTKILNKA
jgi:1,4-dihydroxy-2-naphthoyl-CoA hydrolase